MSGTDLYIAVDGAGRHAPYSLAADGLTPVPVGVAFDTPREAIDFCNGRASRPRLDDSAGAGAPTSGGERAETEAPVTDSASTSTSERTCSVCRGPLPPGSRSDRRTCSGACRRAAARLAAAKARGLAPSTAVPLSAAPAPSDAATPDPTPSEAIGGYALPIASRAARPDTDLSGIEGPGTQTLGL